MMKILLNNREQYNGQGKTIWDTRPFKSGAYIYTVLS